jgi:hypothetical protein
MKRTLGGIMLLDDSLRADHVFLTAADECRCLAEYLPAHGYRAGHVNQLIINLKCPPSVVRTDPRRLHYKLQAIDNIARALRAALSRPSVESATWVDLIRTMTIGCGAFSPRLSAITIWIYATCCTRAKAVRRTMLERAD